MDVCACVHLEFALVCLQLALLLVRWQELSQYDDLTLGEILPPHEFDGVGNFGVRYFDSGERNAAVHCSLAIDQMDDLLLLRLGRLGGTVLGFLQGVVQGEQLVKLLVDVASDFPFPYGRAS